MKGWKVQIDPDLTRVQVGKSRGKAQSLQVVAVGEGRRSDLRVLLVQELPEAWTDDHEAALLESLAEEFSGHWVTLVTGLLHPRWEQLTSGEQRRILAREGLEEPTVWLGEP